MAEGGGTVNAGDVLARLSLDASAFMRGLQEAIAKTEAFQRQMTGSRLPELRIDITPLRQSLSQAETAYHQFFQTVSTQQQQLSQKLGAAPAWMGQSATFIGGAGGARTPGTPGAPPVVSKLPPPPDEHENVWARLGESLLRFQHTWSALFGVMLRDIRAFAEVERGISSMAEGFGQAGRGIDLAGGKLLGFVGIASGIAIVGALAGGALLNLARRAGEFGDMLDKEHLATGIAVRDLQLMETAAKAAGDNLEGLRSVIRTLQRTSAEAIRSPLGTERSQFAQIGIDLADLLEGQKPEKFLDFMAKVFAGTIKIKEAQGVGAAAVLSQALQGRGFQEMAELAEKIAQGRARLAAEQAKIGPLISPEDIKMAADFDEQLKVLWNTLSKFATREIGLPILKTLSPLIGVPQAPGRPGGGLPGPEDTTGMQARLETIRQERAALEAYQATSLPMRVLRNTFRIGLRPSFPFPSPETERGTREQFFGGPTSGPGPGAMQPQILEHIRQEETRLTQALQDQAAARKEVGQAVAAGAGDALLNAKVDQQRVVQIEALYKSELAANHELRAAEVERTQGALAGAAERTRLKRDEIDLEAEHTKTLSGNSSAVAQAMAALAAAEKAGQPTEALQATLDAATKTQLGAFEQIEQATATLTASNARLRREMELTANVPVFRHLAVEVQLFGATLTTGERHVALLRQELQRLLQIGGGTPEAPLGIHAERIKALVPQIREEEVALQPQRTAQEFGKITQDFAKQQRQQQGRLDIQLQVNSRPLIQAQERVRDLQAKVRSYADEIGRLNELMIQGTFNPDQFKAVSAAMDGVALGTVKVQDAFMNIETMQIFSPEEAQQFHGLLEVLAQDATALATAYQFIGTLHPFDAQALERMRASIVQLTEQAKDAQQAINAEEQARATQKATESIRGQAAALRDSLGAMSQSLDVQQREVIVREKIKALIAEGFTPTSENVEQWRAQAAGVVELQHALDGARRPLQELAEAHTTAFVTMQDVTLKTLQSTEAALVEFYTTGKGSAQDFATSIIRDINTAMVRATVTKPLAKMADEFFQGLGGATGATVAPNEPTATNRAGADTGTWLQSTGIAKFLGLEPTPQERKAVATATEARDKGPLAGMTEAGTLPVARLGMQATQTATALEALRLKVEALSAGLGTATPGAATLPVSAAEGTTATGSVEQDRRTLEAITANAVEKVTAERPSVTPGAMTSLQQMVVGKAERLGIDPSWALALAERESNWDPNATSETGVRGLFQVTNKTGSRYGQTPKTRTNPEVSTDAGLRYLADLLKETKGDYPAALRRYNTTDPDFVQNVERFRPQYQRMLQERSQVAASVVMQPAVPVPVAVSPPTARSTPAQDAAWRATLPGQGVTPAPTPAIPPVVPSVPAQEASSSLWSQFTGGLSQLGGQVKQEVSTLKTDITSGLKQATDKIAEGIEALRTGVTALTNMGKDLAPALGRRSEATPSVEEAAPTLSFTAAARGGIFTKPTRVLLGEEGPEAVIPLKTGGVMTPAAGQLAALVMRGVMHPNIPALAEGGVVDGWGMAEDDFALYDRYLAIVARTKRLTEAEDASTAAGGDWMKMARQFLPIAGAVAGGTGAAWIAGSSSTDDEEYNKAFALHRDPITGHVIQGGEYDYATGKTSGGVDTVTGLDWASKVPGARGYVAKPSTGGSSWSQALLSLAGSVAGTYAGQYAGSLFGSGAAGTTATGSVAGDQAAYQAIADRSIGLYGAQHGGRFDKATRVLLGEAGPEAVIPLRGGKIPAMMDGQGRMKTRLPNGIDIPLALPQLPMPHFAEGGVVGGGMPVMASSRAWGVMPEGGAYGRVGQMGNPGGYAGPLVVMNVSTPDVGSFKASRDQLLREAAITLRGTMARNG